MADVTISVGLGNIPQADIARVRRQAEQVAQAQNAQRAARRRAEVEEDQAQERRAAQQRRYYQQQARAQQGFQQQLIAQQRQVDQQRSRAADQSARQQAAQDRQIFGQRVRALRDYQERVAREQYQANRQQEREATRAAERQARQARRNFQDRLQAHRTFLARTAREQINTNRAVEREQARTERQQLASQRRFIARWERARRRSFEQQARDQERQIAAQAALANRGFVAASGGIASGIGIAAAAAGGPVLAGAATAYAVGRATSAFVEQAESLEQIRVRLRTLIPDNEEFARTYDTLYFSSQRYGVELEGSILLYERLRRAGELFNLTQKEIETTTVAVQQALILSGATAQETRSALLQFSQAIGSGRLQGEELRALREAAPRLLQALSEGTGIAIGELRDAGSRGELTTRRLVDAIISQSERLREEAEQIGGTFTRGYTRFTNAIANFIQVANEGLGVTSSLGALLTDLAGILDHVAGRAENAEQSLADVVTPRVLFSASGAAAGAYAGGLAGSAVLPGYGTAVGGVVGGAVGGFGGNVLGGALQDEAAEVEDATARITAAHEQYEEILNSPASQIRTLKIQQSIALTQAERAGIEARINDLRREAFALQSVSEARQEEIDSLNEKRAALDRENAAGLQADRRLAANLLQSRQTLAALREEAQIRQSGLQTGASAAAVERQVAEARVRHARAIVDILEKTRLITAAQAAEERQKIALGDAIARTNRLRQEEAEILSESLSDIEASRQADAQQYNRRVNRLRAEEAQNRELRQTVELRQREIAVLRQANAEGVSREETQRRLQQVQNQHNQELRETEVQNNRLSQSTADLQSEVATLDMTYQDLTQSQREAVLTTGDLREAFREMVTGMLRGTRSLSDLPQVFADLGRAAGARLFESILFGKQEQLDRPLIGNVTGLFGLPNGIIPTLFGQGGEASGASFGGGVLRSIGGPVGQFFAGTSSLFSTLAAGGRSAGLSFAGIGPNFVGPPTQLQSFAGGIGAGISTAGPIAGIGSAIFGGGPPVARGISGGLGAAALIPGPQQPFVAGAAILASLFSGGPLSGIFNQPTRISLEKDSIKDFVEEVYGQLGFDIDLPRRESNVEGPLRAARQGPLAFSENALTALGVAYALGVDEGGLGTVARFRNQTLAATGRENLTPAQQRAGLQATARALGVETQEALFAALQRALQGGFDRDEFSRLEVLENVRENEGEDRATRSRQVRLRNVLAGIIDLSTDFNEAIDSNAVAAGLAADAIEAALTEQGRDVEQYRAVLDQVRDSSIHVAEALTEIGMIEFSDLQFSAEEVASTIENLEGRILATAQAAQGAITQGLSEGLTRAEVEESFATLFEQGIRNQIVSQAVNEALSGIFEGVDFATIFTDGSDAAAILAERVGSTYETIILILDEAGLLPEGFRDATDAASNMADELERAARAQGEADRFQQLQLSRISQLGQFGHLSSLEVAQQRRDVGTSAVPDSIASSSVFFDADGNLLDPNALHSGRSFANLRLEDLRRLGHLPEGITFDPEATLANLARASEAVDQLITLTIDYYQQAISLEQERLAVLQQAARSFAGLSSRIGQSVARFSDSPPISPAEARAQAQQVFNSRLFLDPTHTGVHPDATAEDINEVLGALARAQAQQVFNSRLFLDPTHTGVHPDATAEDINEVLGALARAQAQQVFNSRLFLDPTHTGVHPDATAEDINEVLGAFRTWADQTTQYYQYAIDSEQQRLRLAQQVVTAYEQADQSLAQQAQTIRASQGGLAPTQRLAFLEREESRLRGEISSATGQDRAQLLTQLGQVLTQQVQLNAFQGDPRQEALVQQNLAEIEDLRRDAQSHAAQAENQAERIDQGIQRLRNEAVTELTEIQGLIDFGVMVAQSSADRTEAVIERLREEAVAELRRLYEQQDKLSQALTRLVEETEGREVNVEVSVQIGDREVEDIVVETVQNEEVPGGRLARDRPVGPPIPSRPRVPF